jgi:predicted transcriptional regulator of viral defense system
MSLQAIDKPFFSVADLEKLIGLSGKSLLVTIRRMVDAGILRKVRRNAYTLAGAAFDPVRIAAQLYYPAYLSFEGALARHGILSQIPHTLTFATTRPSNKTSIGSVDVEFTHLKPALYFGYTTINGLDVAEPEKALLDELYLISRGLRHINLDELDLRHLSRSVLKRYVTLYPSPVAKLVEHLLPMVGTTLVTSQEPERIHWHA